MPASGRARPCASPSLALSLALGLLSDPSVAALPPSCLGLILFFPLDPPAQSPEETSAQGFRQLLEVNLLGTYTLIKVRGRSCSGGALRFIMSSLLCAPWLPVLIIVQPLGGDPFGIEDPFTGVA